MMSWGEFGFLFVAVIVSSLDHDHIMIQIDLILESDIGIFFN